MWTSLGVGGMHVNKAVIRWRAALGRKNDRQVLCGSSEGVSYSTQCNCPLWPDPRTPILKCTWSVPWPGSCSLSIQGLLLITDGSFPAPPREDGDCWHLHVLIIYFLFFLALCCQNWADETVLRSGSIQWRRNQGHGASFIKSRPLLSAATSTAVPVLRLRATN